MQLDRNPSNRQGRREWGAAVAGWSLACVCALVPTLATPQPSARIESLVKAGVVEGMRSPNFRA